MSNLVDEIIDNYDNLKYSLLAAQTFDESHFGFPDVYYKIMESDRQRVNAFKKAFELNNNLEGATVCEIGVGTLPLTKLYMPYVKKAYLIENNPKLVDFINEEIAKYPWADKVEVIFADALKIELPESVDFVIGELIHHYPVMFTRHQPMFLTQQFLVNEIELLNEKKQGVKLSFPAPVLFGGTINALYLESYVEITPGANFTGTDSLMPPTVLKTNNTQKVNPGDLVHVDFNFDYGSSLDDVSCLLS